MSKENHKESAFPISDYMGKYREELDELGCPKGLPWAMVNPHNRQAWRNHNQSLKRLAERGGLSPQELVAVLEDRGWSDMTLADSVEKLKSHIAAWEPPE